MLNKITLIFHFILYSLMLTAQTNLSVDLQKNSWLAINGTTNVLSFKLLHSGEKLLDKPINITATAHHNKIYLSENKLTIKVNNFSSDNKMALRDFLKLIKSDSFPTMDIRLKYVETSSGINQYAKGIALLHITITGITKPYYIPMNSSRHGEYISVDGTKKINIRDFGLEPPIEMFGLIKVSEWISINFHLVCKLTVENDITQLILRENIND